VATPPLYGREIELAALGELIASVGDRGSALVLKGEPGIGKSALLAAATRSAGARDMVVLTAAGVHSEAHLPFAGLHQLLQQLLPRIDELPGPQRDALKAAFGMTDKVAPELVLIALATLELLADAAARSPLLVVADDAQWLDGPSCEVLAFIARRVSFEPILVLIALREGSSGVFEAAGIPERELERLDAAAAARLLDAQGSGLALEVRARLLDEAAGNPLALVELPSALYSGNVVEMPWMSEPLPLTAKLERAFAARSVDLPADARTALVVAAALDGNDVPVVLRAAGIVEGKVMAVDVLEPAIAARLIDIDGTSFSFRHPLVRSALYAAASFAERRDAHAAIADALAGEPDRRVWHRAASSVGPDRAIADELESAADRARRRGATGVALAALQRAAKLTDDPALRGSRLLRAGEMAFELGGPDLGNRFLRDAESHDLAPTERIRLSLLRELFEDEGLWAGTARVAAFVEVIDQVRIAGDIELALKFLVAVAQRCWWANLDQETRDLVVAAAERMPLAKDSPALIAILAFADPIEHGGVVIDRIAGLDVHGDHDAGAVRLLGAAATAVGAFDLSPGFLATSVNGLRAEGRIGLLAQALVSQAWAAFFLGDWRLAIPAAEEAGRLARETAQPRWAAAAQLCAATLAAVRGDYEAADVLAAEAEPLLLPMAAHPTLAFVQLARGLTALSRGRHTDAYEHLRRIFDPADIAYHPFVRCWTIGDLAEAAARCGRAEDAQALVSTLDPVAERSRSPLLRVGMDYARPLLADDDVAEGLFNAALSAEMSHWPLHRARVLLAYGSWLRRRLRVAESRAPLRAARQEFDALGAIPWGERARQELRAAGERSRQRTPEAWNELSPQELQIAQMAAGGLTNREIGQNLYLSHRTVGSHLYRIFPKLGVTSRSQLTAALAGSSSTVI
jgi:DNA-binding CsgD family transcriptional regulator